MTMLKVRAERPVLGLATDQMATVADSPYIRSVIQSRYLTLLEEPLPAGEPQPAEDLPEDEYAEATEGRRGRRASPPTAA